MQFPQCGYDKCRSKIFVKSILVNVKSLSIQHFEKFFKCNTSAILKYFVKSQTNLSQKASILAIFT